MSVGTAEEILDSMSARASSSAILRVHWSVPGGAHLRADTACGALGPLALTSGACVPAFRAGPNFPAFLGRLVSLARSRLSLFTHFSRFLLSHPISPPTPPTLIPAFCLSSLPPSPAIPRFFDLFPQPCRPKRSHTGTLKLTPHTPRLKQSQAQGPLFHFLGHFLCPFLPIRSGLLPRSTFQSPGRPDPPF